MSTHPLFCIENRDPSLSNNSLLFDSESVIKVVKLSKDIVVLDNVFSDKDCENIINTYRNNTDIFKNQRSKICIDFSKLSDIILERCKEYIPTSVYKENTDVYEHNHKNSHFTDYKYWNKPEINSNWRFVHCKPESSMTQHYDGVLVKTVDYKSIYTIMFYLSNNNDGATYFIKDDVKILPKKGRVCIFDQSLLHKGLTNKEEKYFLRSEIMYHRQFSIETENDKNALILLEKAKKVFKVDIKLCRELEEQAFKLSPNLENAILNI